LSRAPFQVLVYPYYKDSSGTVEYALLKRSDEGWWQAVAGGGENDEEPLHAAQREAFEEAGIPTSAPFIRLSTVIPNRVTEFADSYLWGEHIYVIPQYCFGVLLTDKRIALSSEHSEYRWLNYEEAQELVRYDGNRTALWELHMRLKGQGPRG
jgi:dATP pyrophosphohydrolase